MLFADGELSYDEAAAVKSLGTVLQGMGIMYFNELAYFTGLEEIAENAFAKCRRFTEIILPESVRSVGHSAFYGCENASRIELPDRPHGQQRRILPLHELS